MSKGDAARWVLAGLGVWSLAIFASAQPAASTTRTISIGPGAPDPVPDLRVVVLQHVTPDEMSDILNSIRMQGAPLTGRGKLTIATQDSRRRLILIGDEQAVACYARLAEELDTPKTADDPADKKSKPKPEPTSVVMSQKLQYANASAVAAQMQKLDLLKVNIVADTSARMIWVHGATREAAVAACELARQMDVTPRMSGAEASDPTRSMRFYKIEHGNAARVASTLNDALRIMDVHTRAVGDPAAGVVMAYVDDATAERIAQIVAKIDTAEQPQRVIRSRRGAVRHDGEGAGRGRRGAGDDEGLRGERASRRTAGDPDASQDQTRGKEGGRKDNRGSRTGNGAGR